jgi:XTP/dITP diphosphohydrolase
MMEGLTDRSARFRTVMALIIQGQIFTFEGIIEGEITTTKSGKDGFGYDPIFQPSGYEQTFAEMGEEEKNKISHRAMATNKMLAFLKLNF